MKSYKTNLGFKTVAHVWEGLGQRPHVEHVTVGYASVIDHSYATDLVVIVK